MSEPRIAPGRLARLGPVNWLACRALGLATGTPDGNLFRTLALNHRLFRAWLVFGGRLMMGGRLPRRETELVILRVGHLRGCRYEVDHHERIAPRFGVDREALARVEEGPRAEGWCARERALLAAVDSLVERGDVDDEDWASLSTFYEEDQLVELCLLVGHYEMLATLIATLRIARDGFPTRARAGSGARPRRRGRAPR